MFPFLTGMDAHLRDTVMLHVLMELNQLASADRAILEQLQATAFVTPASGQLRCPKDLYDPRYQTGHQIPCIEQTYIGPKLGHWLNT